MKRALSVMLAIALVIAPAAGLTLEVRPVAGCLCFPEGTTEDSARYVLKYSFPEVVPEGDTDTELARMLADSKDDALFLLTGLISQKLSEPSYDDEKGVVTVDYQIANDGADYLSLIYTMTEMYGLNEESAIVTSTYAKTGEYAGRPITLSAVMGLETESGESDISDYVYSLVWDIISGQGEDFTVEYFPDIVLDELRRTFEPERDFYIDQDDNIVFYIQSGDIASSIYGAVTFPFSRAELLSVMRE